jgi:hypothetical protein
MNLKEEVNKALDKIPGARASFFYPQSFPPDGQGRQAAISFYELSNTEGILADDEEYASDIDMQVDVWSKGSASRVAEEVVKAMRGLGFNRAFAGDLYEKESGLNHKTMRFNIKMDV